SLTVVAADYVPVAPRSVSSLFVGVGQRYDVLIRADQAPGDYFLNVTFPRSTHCGSSKNPSPAAVFSYVAGQPGSQEAAAEASPAPKPTPATPQHAEAADAHCTDLRDLAPIVQRQVPLERFEPGKQRSSSLNLELKVDEKAARVFWTVNKSAINVSWSEPTLSRIKAGGVERLGTSANVVKIPTADSWSFWIVQNTSPVPHPMHLHGHDLVLVGQSEPPTDQGSRPRAYDDAKDRGTLRPDNPTRRDTTMLPALGWIVLAFETNNPGAWLFHCHLAWHVSQGLSVQYLERPGEVAGAMDLGSTQKNCEAWRAFYPQRAAARQQDSGI
ncbi:hypothetical protein MAPG_01944, partial [Magnaporthiopsis poae ATCC 64411]